MASITSTELGSGLDIETLVIKLMSVEQQPLTLLQSHESKENAKLSSWGQIKSALCSLQFATHALDTRSEFTTYKTTATGTGLSQIHAAKDATTITAGTLNRDSTARNLMSQIRSILTSSVGDGRYSTLSSVGIAFQKNGSLALDSSKLQKAVDNKETDIAALFVKDSSSTGIASKLGTSVEPMLSSRGSVTAHTDGINTTIKTIDKQIDTLTDRLAAIEKHYRAQFTALDSTIASLKSTSSYLTQQLSALSSTTSSSS